MRSYDFASHVGGLAYHPLHAVQHDFSVSSNPPSLARVDPNFFDRVSLGRSPVLPNTDYTPFHGCKGHRDGSRFSITALALLPSQPSCKKRRLVLFVAGVLPIKPCYLERTSNFQRDRAN